MVHYDKGITTLNKSLTTGGHRTSRARARNLPRYPFLRLQVNPLVTRGSNLLDRLLWARAIVLAAAERHKVHVPGRGGGWQLTYVGSSKLAFFFS